MMPGPITPIALFVFKRADHTARTLEALAANPEFRQLPLFVFCDGPRRDDEKADVEATRNVIRDLEHPNKIVVERTHNVGLANSIIEGVGKLCTDFGRVIVLEDDLVVSSGFLAYMLAALNRYQDAEQVMQISGHAFPVETFTPSDPVLFLPFISSWGWATWDRAWAEFDPSAGGWQDLLRDRNLARAFDMDGAYPYSAMLAAQMRGQIDSWAVRWNWSVFRRNACVVYPPVSLVTNVGFDGSGTHLSSNARFATQQVASGKQISFPEPPAAPERDDPRYRLVRASVRAMQGSLIRRLAKRIMWYERRRRMLHALARSGDHR